MLFDLLFYIILVMVSVYDLKNHKIPDKLSFLIFIVGLGGVLFLDSPGLSERLWGIIITPLLPIVCNVFRKSAFGGGDIKLLAVCGWFLGLKAALIGLAISILVCGIYCMAGICLAKTGRKTVLAFGPFISIGMIIARIFGDQIVTWYIS